MDETLGATPAISILHAVNEEDKNTDANDFCRNISTRLTFYFYNILFSGVGVLNNFAPCLRIEKTGRSGGRPDLISPELQGNRPWNAGKRNEVNEMK